jgi:hypothetical protein
MPSLIGTTVAANYLTMGSLDTYADGAYYANFGTRNLKALLINKSTAGTSADMTKGADGAAGTFKDANSLLSRITRCVQQFAEIYYIGVPTSTDVVMLVSADTLSTTGLATALATAVNSGSFGSSGTAFTVTASGSTDSTQIFVGNARGTFA